MAPGLNKKVLWFFLLFIGCFAALAGCEKKSSPEMTAEVTWKFTEGSSGFVAMPNAWDVTTTIKNNGGQVWTVAPDMIVGESLGSDTLAKGICLSERQKQWNAASPVTVNPSPSQKEGKYEEYTYSPPDADGRMTVQWGDSKAILKQNGKETKWAAVEMKKGDLLEYGWESRNFVTFKTDLKGTDRHRVFQLGPIIYDASSPSAPSYLLVAEAGAGGKAKDQWRSEAFRFVPLTAEDIRRQVEDAARSDVWRCHFLILLWSQPRPVADAGRYILEFFTNERYPLALRSTAARSLLETRYVPAREALLTTARDSKANLSLRSLIVGGLDRMLDPEEVSVLSGFAADASTPLQVRKRALESLARMGEQGKMAIQQLAQDKELKETARGLLKEMAQTKK